MASFAGVLDPGVTGAETAIIPLESAVAISSFVRADR
jgi:hypothetical protein